MDSFFLLMLRYIVDTLGVYYCVLDKMDDFFHWWRLCALRHLIELGGEISRSSTTVACRLLTHMLAVRVLAHSLQHCAKTVTINH
jgi:hypothetical protein